MDDNIDERDERLAEAAAENERLQSEAADAEARLAALTQALQEARRDAEDARSTATSLGDGYRRAVEQYRDAVAAAQPDIPPELLSGETVEQVQESLRTAQAMVEQVRERLADESPTGGPPGPRVPPGAPVRRAPDIDSLPARQKIAEGLRQQQT